MADTDDRRMLAWSTFRTAFVDPGLGADIPVMGEPAIVLFVTPGSSALGMRVRAITGSLPDPQLRSVHVGRSEDDVVLSTTDRDLFQPFYALLLELIDRLQLEHESVGTAIALVLQGWRRLLASMMGLPEERQVGLSGELWTLQRLTKVWGPEVAVPSWVGPTAEAHDFRLELNELEVKTTRTATRRHQIAGLGQLAPSPGHELHVLSIQLAAAGGGPGWTLSEQVDDLRTVVGDGEAGALFEQLLNDAGWRDDDAGAYTQRWTLRAAPRLVTVDEQCPRLTTDLVNAIAGPLSARIDGVKYTIDLESLGALDGTPEFLSVIPVGDDR
jgi:hypothetical protein